VPELGLVPGQGLVPVLVPGQGQGLVPVLVPGQHSRAQKL